jgi:phospholipid transport system substrate-binding protein
MKILVDSMFSRRFFLAGLAAVVATPSHAAGEHPAETYMKQVGKDMLSAHRQGTVAAFKRAVLRHADVATIAEYSLGKYESKLPTGQRQKYYRGVATFISRYFAEQSRAYPIAKFEIGEARSSSQSDVQIITKVFLMSGQVYDVKWKLVWRGGRYKVADAKVLGFSLTYMQRNLFTDFIGKRNGDVNKLVAALNS